MVNNTTARKFIFKEEIKVVQGEERYNRIYRVGQNQVKKKKPCMITKISVDKRTRFPLGIYGFKNK